MIKALLLIFDPVATWERIIELHRGVVSILLFYLLPLLLLTSAGEYYGLVEWGKARGEFGHVTRIPQGVALNYILIQFVLSLFVVFIGAAVIKAIGETFHGRHTYTQAFTSVAHGLGPLFLARLLDAWQQMPMWVSWGVGIALSVSVLYHGLPRVMLPDPPHALGLYFISALMLIIVTALARFLTSLILQQQIRIVYFLPAGFQGCLN